jgi:hypothetical protein
VYRAEVATGGKPSREAIAEARWQAFDTIGETADLTASYCRSIVEAAYRRDQVELAVHIRQVIACVRSMARVYREGIEDGQDLAEGGRSEGRAGGDRQGGDAVGDDRSS